MKRRGSPIELRKKQIEREIERVYEQASKWSRQDFKSQQGFERWQESWPEKIAYLRRELSALNDPGEYDELPIAVVAEELGLTSDKVHQLISGGDVEPSDTSEDSPRDRIMRAELERIIDLGIDEILRLSEQESAEIFDSSLALLSEGGRAVEVRSSRPDRRAEALPL